MKRFLLEFVTTAVLAGNGVAGTIPHFSLDYSVGHATDIVVAEAVGLDQFRVIETLHGSLRPDDRIAAAGFSENSRAVLFLICKETPVTARCAWKAASETGATRDAAMTVEAGSDLASLRKTIERNGRKATPPLEFSDDPAFVAAGVTAGTSQGGHGSDVVLRSSEALTKAAVSLGGNSAPEGDPLAALLSDQRAVERDASERNLFGLGAELLVHLSNDQAIGVFERGHRLYLESLRMTIGLAVAHYWRGDYAEAAKYFFAACDQHPADRLPYLVLGSVASEEIIRLDGYRSRMKRFAVAFPEDACASYQYAASLWEDRRVADQETRAQVTDLLGKAIAINPRFGRAHLLLGTVLSENGDLAGARENLEEAARLSPDLEESHYRLAQTYRLLGDVASAARELAIYRELSRASSERATRERSEAQRFVFAQRDP